MEKRPLSFLGELTLVAARAILDSLVDQTSQALDKKEGKVKVRKGPRLWQVCTTDRPRESTQQQGLPYPEVETFYSGQFSTKLERVPPIEVVEMCEVYFLICYASI